MVRWCVVAVLLAGYSCAADDNRVDNTPPAAADNDDFVLKQVVWKRCYRKLSAACLKLNLIRTVEMMSRDSTFALVPGVFFSSNGSVSDALPPDIARSLSSEHAPLDDLVAYTLEKYLRSLTLNVNLVDYVSGGNDTLQDSVFEVVSGRGKKDGYGGYGAVAMMMGAMMASMMMAGMAALAGKALMTSLLALMLAAFSAMKGGGGGDHETKTYEVITKPVVSHINTHSSEVQHDHGHYHRSLGLWGEGVGSVDWKRGEERDSEINRQEKDHGVGEPLEDHRVGEPLEDHRSKRDVHSSDPPDSKIYKIFKLPTHQSTTGHPEKYKRSSEDDLTMTLGLFR